MRRPFKCFTDTACSAFSDLYLIFSFPLILILKNTKESESEPESEPHTKALHAYVCRPTIQGRFVKAKNEKKQTKIQTNKLKHQFVLNLQAILS